VSNHLISTTYKRELRTPMRKSVMALLADKASDDGSGIYASKQTMADELCCSKQTIIDTIKSFMADGLIVELGTRRAPNGFTVEYGIVVDALEALPLVRCHADREARKSGRLTGQPNRPVREIDRSASLTPPVQQVDPNPPEPSSSTIATQSPKKDGPAKPTLLPEHVLEAWNDMAARIGLPKAKMTAERRKLLNVRIRAYSVTDFTEAIECVERNPWMHGENDRGWRADFDFFLQQKSFVKLVEGSYDRAS
jgi:hypothetical protein